MEDHAMKLRVLGVLLCVMLALAGQACCYHCFDWDYGARMVKINTVDGPGRFMIKSHSRGSRTRKYALFVPQKYVPEQATIYPTIIFLHGGVGGSDGETHLASGLELFVASMSSSFRFICIFPQSD